MITGMQCRMARASLGFGLRELGDEIGCSHMAIKKFEEGGDSAFAQKIEAYFLARGIYFGPKDGVCIGEDVFNQERKLIACLWQILSSHGVQPSSRELIENMPGIENNQSV